MDRPALMAIVLALLVVLLALMVLGWRARKRRQSWVARPLDVPTDSGTEHTTVLGKYVATTASGDPLDRIVVHGLGFRGSASVTVTSTGVIVKLVGREDFWIPASDITTARRATWTIDRVVEQDGLQVIGWRLGGRDVDSFFRLDAPADLEQSVAKLIDSGRTPE